MKVIFVDNGFEGHCLQKDSLHGTPTNENQATNRDLRDHHVQSIYFQMSCPDGHVQKFHNEMEPCSVETTFSIKFMHEHLSAILEGLPQER
ncbi:hypothetical protein CEXT_757211 [Caerostris extrusa]|uniref:Uncharacterized protein n=1 Tax=Caerostris extrusa TaxID=172846 RepID=A0AAV4NUR5_CAEEX|nr:hypothetical protein CEXT_757211 [Caerostris extrusa]